MLISTSVSLSYPLHGEGGRSTTRQMAGRKTAVRDKYSPNNTTIKTTTTTQHKYGKNSYDRRDEILPFHMCVYAFHPLLYTTYSYYKLYTYVRDKQTNKQTHKYSLIYCVAGVSLFPGHYPHPIPRTHTIHVPYIHQKLTRQINYEISQQHSCPLLCSIHVSRSHLRFSLLRQHLYLT